MTNRIQMLVDIANEAMRAVLWIKQFIATLNTVLVDQRLEHLIGEIQEFLKLFPESQKTEIPLEFRVNTL